MAGAEGRGQRGGFPARQGSRRGARARQLLPRRLALLAHATQRRTRPGHPSLSGARRGEREQTRSRAQASGAAVTERAHGRGSQVSRSRHGAHGEAARRLVLSSRSPRHAVRQRIGGGFQGAQPAALTAWLTVLSRSLSLARSLCAHSSDQSPPSRSGLPSPLPVCDRCITPAHCDLLVASRRLWSPVVLCSTSWTPSDCVFRIWRILPPPPPPPPPISLSPRASARLSGGMIPTAGPMCSSQVGFLPCASSSSSALSARRSSPSSRCQQASRCLSLFVRAHGATLHGGRYHAYLATLPTSVHLRSLLQAMPWLRSSEQLTQRLADPLAVLDIMTLEWNLEHKAQEGNQRQTDADTSTSQSHTHTHRHTWLQRMESSMNAETNAERKREQSAAIGNCYCSAWLASLLAVRRPLVAASDAACCFAGRNLTGVCWVAVLRSFCLFLCVCRRSGGGQLCSVVCCPWPRSDVVVCARVGRLPVGWLVAHCREQHQAGHGQTMPRGQHSSSRTRSHAEHAHYTRSHARTRASLTRCVLRGWFVCVPRFRFWLASGVH